MPSNVVAQVLEITDLRPHPNADRLELATLGGWQIVCGKGLYEEGERVVYVTPDSLITERLADALGIRQYLSSVKNLDGTFVTNDNGEVMLRVRQAKLRGEPSFGTTIPRDLVIEFTSTDKDGNDLPGCDIEHQELGLNLADALGILKYEPQMRASAGDADVDHALFPKYTSVENLRNYPNVLEEGELVSVSIKIHGTNCRVGLVEGEWMAGSHGLRRKNPVYGAVTYDEQDYEKIWERNTYWYPLSKQEVRNLIVAVTQEYNAKQVILYGEVYGNVQKKYNYGVPNGIDFRAFDLLVDGKYLDVDEFYSLCLKHSVPTVVLGATNIPYSYDYIRELAEGVEKDPLGNHPIEGVVVRPMEERTDHKVGRVILKYITDTYLFDKGGSDFKDV